MPPLRVYEVTVKRETMPDYGKTFEFKDAESVALFLNEKLKHNHLKRYHIINYMRKACQNKHYNAMSIALDNYKIGYRKVKHIPTDFENGRVKQSQCV